MSLLDRLAAAEVGGNLAGVGGVPSSGGGAYAPGDEFARRYVVESLLGSGFQAEVYAVRNKHTAVLRALKLLKARHRQNAEYVQRFLQEAGQLSHLQHKNLVRVYDAGVEESGEVWMLMEMLDGRSLRLCLQAIGKLSVPLSLYVVAEMARGIAIAHDKDVIHRDLKPENVMLTKAGVKVLDFGIAKVYGSSVPTTDRRLRTLGTIAYMAPEQVAAQPPDAKVDVYAAGIILYELLTGLHPFHDALHNAMEVGKRHMFHRPPPIAEHLSDVPAYIEPILDAALHKNRDLRPAMAGLAEMLDKALLRYESDVQAARIGWSCPPHEVPIWAALRPESPLGASPISTSRVEAAPVAGSLLTTPGHEDISPSAALGFAPTSLAASEAPTPRMEGAPQPQATGPQGTQALPPEMIEKNRQLFEEAAAQEAAARAAGPVKLPRTTVPMSVVTSASPLLMAAPVPPPVKPTKLSGSLDDLARRAGQAVPAFALQGETPAPVTSSSRDGAPAGGVSVRAFTWMVAAAVPIAIGVTWVVLDRNAGGATPAATTTDASHVDRAASTAIPAKESAPSDALAPGAGDVAPSLDAKVTSPPAEPTPIKLGGSPPVAPPDAKGASNPAPSKPPSTPPPSAPPPAAATPPPAVPPAKPPPTKKPPSGPIF